VFLLLDGVIVAEVDGELVAELGPGAVLGERAVLEGGVRTATLRASTRCKVAVASGEQLDPAALAELSAGHRREEDGSGVSPAGQSA
jgi:CRP-like cAMP-binding protein